MTDESMSAELRDEIASSSRRHVVDPRTVPVRFSTLKRIGQSPLHYHEACQSGGDDTLARRLGRGVHAMLFGQPLVVWHKRRQGKAWDEFEEANADKEILNESEHAQALGMVNALRRDPIASPLLFDGTVTERKIQWRLDGRQCQGTPDVVGPGRVVDLKTAKSSEPGKFCRDASWMAYHAQLAWYQDGLDLAMLGRPEEAYIVAVEKVPPYAVTTLRATERALDQGRRLTKLWWERLRVCEASNEWPGYSQSIVDFDIAEAGDVTLSIDGEDFEL